jgi:hypothetical protein
MPFTAFLLQNILEFFLGFVGWALPTIFLFSPRNLLRGVSFQHGNIIFDFYIAFFHFSF